MSSEDNNSMKPWTVVLTGASGYLGQHCLKALLSLPSSSQRQHLHVHALHQSTPELQNAVDAYCKTNTTITTTTTVTVTAVDLTSAEECHRWVAALPHPVDGCIHTAALSSPLQCEQQPDTAVAVNVPKHFFDCLYASNPAVCILALSMDQVYDGFSAPYNETSPAVPCNTYGKTKVALEDYLLQQQQQRYPESTAILLRSSILLGPLAPLVPDKAHTTFLHFCASRVNDPTTYYTDEIRSVIAVQDVVAVLTKLLVVLVLESTTPLPISGIYCMGGPAPVSRYDMAVAVVHHHHHHLRTPNTTTMDQVQARTAAVVVPALKASVEPPQPAVVGTAGSSVTAVAVRSPLDIRMDSTKLLQTVGMTTHQFMTLSEMVESTFLAQLDRD
jgi:dTDP-4-dehydrorhamnose reductase